MEPAIINPSSSSSSSPTSKREMWVAICLALVATAGNNIGKVLQKKGTVSLPPLSFKFKVIKAYAINKAWFTGFLMDISGAAFMLTALSLAPVSIIQPVSGCGLAILCVFSHFYLKEVMNAIDWVGIVLAGVGTIGIGIGGEEKKSPDLSIFHLPWLVFIIAILFVLLNTWLRMCKHQRREQELMQSDVVEEIILGLESGILFGMESVISKMGFVFLEQGFSKMLFPVCIIISISCGGIGFIYQTRGLKHGRAIVVSTCASVASIVAGVLAGMFALGERLPTASSARLVLLLGWLCIIFGVILLVSSRKLMTHLPRPLKHFLHDGGGVERNPSAVIEASTLYHLIPSPSAVIEESTLHHLIPSPSAVIEESTLHHLIPSPSAVIEESTLHHLIPSPSSVIEESTLHHLIPSPSSVIEESTLHHLIPSPSAVIEESTLHHLIPSPSAVIEESTLHHLIPSPSAVIEESTLHQLIPSPSAVIQESTLHHLITSPKEKA